MPWKTICTLSIFILTAFTLAAAGETPLYRKAITAKDTVTLFDLRSLNRMSAKNPDEVRAIWDQMHAIATLQGTVNRAKPRLYLFYIESHGVDIDSYWWNKYRTAGKWLEKATTDTVRSVAELVARFRNDIRGAVVYDRKQRFSLLLFILLSVNCIFGLYAVMKVVLSE